MMKMMGNQRSAEQIVSDNQLQVGAVATGALLNTAQRLFSSQERIRGFSTDVCAPSDHNGLLVCVRAHASSTRVTRVTMV